ncbi:hypothetical protein SAMN05421686_107223 [Thalassolituus maritimus]|uniref:Imelysin-like domain-containing protein n=1 Tax=Thalassolituus maritimus TaxID=484498 RepID=A0A1N7NS27_9GAMM|nr:imelysin family protein [Thalassolituus maritimus]SIT01039.1 hypothetical protein SAMN05421686_107223 [Thalassolituus maritimus]
MNKPETLLNCVRIDDGYRRHYFRTAAAILLAGLLTACGGERKNDPLVLTDDTLNTALTRIVDQTVIPNTQAFAEDAEALVVAASSFCNAPNTDGLQQTQSAWEASSTGWYRILPFLFGPPDDNLLTPGYLFIDSLRQRGNDYTSTIRTEINESVSGSEPLNGAYFDGLSFTKVGLLALEVALFEDASESSADSDIVAGFIAHPRRCDYLEGLAQLQAEYANDFYQGWTSDYQNSGEAYRERFLRGATDDGSAPLTLLLTSAQEHLNYLKQRTVADQAGQISGISSALMQASIEATEAIVEGDQGSVVTLASLMLAAQEESALLSVRDNFERAYEAIDDQSNLDFYTAAGLLDGNFKREIPDGLAVELGINFSDGD